MGGAATEPTGSLGPTQFRQKLEHLDEVLSVDAVTRDGESYWAIETQGRVITPAISELLARYDRDATFDDGTLFVPVTGLVFEGEHVRHFEKLVELGVDMADLDERDINETEVIREWIDQNDGELEPIRSLADEFPHAEDVEGELDVLDLYRDIKTFLQALVLDESGDPVIDPAEDRDFLVVQLPSPSSESTTESASTDTES